MKRLDDHINLIRSANSAQDIFERFAATMNDFGYDKVSYGCATDCPSLGLKKRHGHISNFPSDWLTHYAKNNLSEVDPVHVHAVKKRTPSFWSACEQGAPAESIQLMRDAADAGLGSGIIIPICGTGSEVSMISLSKKEKAGDEESYESLAAINLLGAYFFEGYKSFLKKPDKVELSTREYEILCWAADGKTDAEIAMIINISAATVRYHWNNIFKKLDAYNRVYAVSKAVHMQLVTPYRIGSS